MSSSTKQMRVNEVMFPPLSVFFAGEVHEQLRAVLFTSMLKSSGGPDGAINSNKLCYNIYLYYRFIYTYVLPVW